MDKAKRLAGLLFWLLGAAAAHAQTNIPLQLVTVPALPGYSYQRLLIDVGVGGGAPHPYLFDTGSSLFNVPASFVGQTNSILADGAGYFYGDGNGYYGDLATVPSVTFYAPGTSTAVAAETAGGSGFVVNEVHDHLLGTNPGGGARTINIYDPSTRKTTTYWIDPNYPNGKNGVPPIEGIIYGTFGAGDFATVVGNGTAPGTSTYTNVTVGSILGQSVTSGYVVAANAAAGQNVTNCSPCVMLGLTPALAAQFASIEPWDSGTGIGAQKFPVSGANSSTEFGVTFEYTASYKGHVVVFSGPSLLDSGTQDLNLHTTKDVSKLETLVAGYLNEGATVTMTGYVPGSAAVGFTAANPNTALMTYQITLGPDGRKITAIQNQTPGIGFFLQNSVLYNLAGQEVGYTPNFVTDQNITAPLDVTAADGPLGLAGVISGGGGVALESGALATLSGTNLYTGATQIAPGAELLLVGPGSIAASSGVEDLGTFDLSGVTAPVTAAIQGLTGNGSVLLGGNTLVLTNATGTFSGTLADGGFYGGAGGALVLAGGNETLTGSNEYTGGTVVDGGAVLTIASDQALGAATGGVTLNNGTLVTLGNWTASRAVTVAAAGGALNANGNNVTLNGMLTLAGRLTLAGHVTLGAASVSLFDLTAAQGYGQMLDAAGPLTLNGTLVPVLSTAGPSLGQVFTIVAAPGGLQGRYALAPPQGGLAPGLRLDTLYSPVALSLVATPAFYADLPAAGVAETANEAAAGAMLDSIRPAAGAAMGTAAGALFTPLYQQSASGVTVALAQLAPAITGDSLVIRRNAWELVGQAVDTQQAAARGAWFQGQQEAPLGANGRIWMTGLGQAGSIGGNNAPSYHGTLSGFVAGADAPLGRLRAGAAVSYVSGTGNDQIGGHFSGDGVTGLAYGSVQQGAAFVDASFGGGVFESNTSQKISFAGTQTSGRANGTDLGGAIAAGFDMARAGWQIEPSLKLTVAQFWQAGYGATASNPAFDLSLAPAGLTSVQTQAGVWLERSVALTRGWTLLPDAQLGWRHEYADETALVTASYTGLGGVPFSVQSATMGRDAAVLGAGVVAQSAGSLALYLNYTGEVNGQSNAENFAGGVRMAW